MGERDVCCDGLYFEPDFRTERATFGMNCFWGPEARFGVAPGVVRTRVGYAGGTVLNPTYSFIADYTETVDIEFDPLLTSYEKLLDIFWSEHDPTLNCSKQYQSVIFYHSPEQRDLAEKTLRREVGNRSRPIKTRIFPAKEFYEAENFHQKFFLQKYPWLLEYLDIKVGMPLVRSKVAARLNGYVAGYAPLQCFEGEWRKLGLCCEVVEYVRKIICLNYRKKIGCPPY
jgi:peptide-methionine (S)-S-oxide reductase